MKDDKRACFALIVASIVNNRRYYSVYDFMHSQYINISSSALLSNYLSFFDYNRGGYISGNASSMYDYPTSSYVSMTKSGNVVSCYDFEVGAYVNYTVNGAHVIAYDYQMSTYYNYRIS